MPFIGDTGQLSNIYEKNHETTTLRIHEGDTAFQAYNPADSHYKLITTLQEITDIGNVTSNTLQFSNAITGFTTTSNVGIANSTPTHTLDVGSKAYIDENASNTFWTSGTLYADKVLSETTEITNSVTTRDVLADKFFPKTNGFIEVTSNVGVLNTAPVHTLDIGANVQIDEYGSNTFWTSGNVYSEHYKGPNVTVSGSVDTDQLIVNDINSKDTDFVNFTSNVGVLNTAPVHTLDIGANVQIDEYGSNTFWTSGNVHADKYTGSEIQLSGVIRATDFILAGGSQATPTPDLQTISEVLASGGGAPFSSDRTLTLSNVTTALDATIVRSITTHSNIIADNVTVANDLTIGTDKLFVDVSTSKVGINNASPSKDLDVTGEIASSGNLTIGTNKLFVDVSTSKVGINKSVPTKDLDVTGEIASSSNLTIGANKLFVDVSASKVGINNASPSKDLDVTGEIASSSNLTIGTDKLFVDVSTSKVGINNASPSKDLDVTGEIASSGNLTIGTNKLFVDVSTSKVGINKSVPTKDLDVTGEIASSSNLTIGANKLFVDVSASKVGINNASPSKDLDVTGEIASSSNLTIGTDKLFVDVSTSKVGINNASPSKDLDVTGEIASSGNLTIGTNKLFVDVSTSKVGINKSVPTKDLDVTGEIASSSNLTIGANKLFVDVSASKVGINNASPSKDLDVTGEIACSSHLTVGGNLTVNGTTTTVNTTSLRVEDTLIELGKNNTAGASDLGLILKRPTGVGLKSNVAIVYSESLDTLKFGHTLSGSDATPVVFDTSNTLAMSLNGSFVATGTVRGSSSLTPGSYLTGSAYNGGANQTFAVDATSTNTANTVVARDASGNFSAGTITATFSGNGSGLSALNVSNVSSGTLDNARLPSTINVTNLVGNGSGLSALNASNVSSGTLDNARLPSTINVTNLVGNGSGLSALNASNVSSGTLDNARLPSTINVTNLVGNGSGLSALNASNVSSGTLDNARLPSTINVTNLVGNGSGLSALNASNVSSGTLDAARIPSLDATKITTGTLDNARIPSLNASKITAGTLDAARIPSLDATKITTGTLDAARIPSLDATKITTGTLDAARIPNLNASKITAGTLDAARIPSLDATKITTGTLGTARIPDLDASKITAGTLSRPISTTNGTFSGSVSFGSDVRQMINLYSTTYGIGIQSSTLYYRSGGGYAWFKGGVHSDTINTPGSGGVLAMRLDSSYNLITTGNVTAYSDKRVKTDIRKIEDPLNKLCSINGYTYKRTDTDDDKTHTGVLAQEVIEVLPEVVHGSEDTTYSVAYGNMVGLLIEAIKELKLEIDELKKSR
jgi:hypothetical protein